MLDLDDLDLEPPLKQRRILIETTAVYEVWVDDDEDLGAEQLATRLNRDAGDLSDLIRNESAIDGGITARAPDEWEQQSLSINPQHGPWQICPFPGCDRPQYPGYGLDPTCHRHRVEGCKRMNLPEKEFSDA